MIPLVKHYTRRFHFTSNVFLRKIAPKTSYNVQKHAIPESNFDSSSNSQSSCPDYLGIENDTNVITVNPQKHRFHQPEMKDTREKFYHASFGIVRLDADNKLKYHGQYKKKVDFTFPHNSSEVVKVSNISQSPSNENQTVSLSLKNSQTVSAVDVVDIKEPLSSEKNHLNVNYIDEYYFGDSETNNFAQSKAQQPTPEELNFLEKDYFEPLLHSRSPSLSQDASKYADSEQIGEDLNYLKKELLETSNNSERLHVKQDFAEYSNPKKVDGSLDQPEELNYLEKGYIGTLNNSESHPVKEDISDCTDNEKKVNSVFDLKNQKNNDFTASVNELSFLDKSFYETCSLSNNHNSTHYDDLLKSSPHFVENNVINEDIYNQFNERNVDSKTKSQSKVLDSEFNDNSVNNFKKLTQKQAHKVDIEKLSACETQKSDIMSYENTEPSAESLSASKELSNEAVKLFSKGNKFKFSRPVSEEPKQDNEISTAHDFVEILRKEQKIPSQGLGISKGKSTTEEKLDSKGFRILKNQVPNLSYFTHDEILNILKQNIVYSDDDLLVLNKPYNLVIHESQTTKDPCLSTFLDALAKEMDTQSTNPKLFTVHRIDKETTGCLLLARNETMAMHLKGLLAQRKIVKKYWIITAGVPDPPEGVIDMPISEGSVDNRKRMVLHPKLPSDILYRNHSKDGKHAVTTYKVISQSGNAALVEVFPKTGIKHQIRVHFGFGLGCPILGDHKYSHLDKLVPQKLPSDMLQRLNVRQSKVRHIPMHIHAKSVGIPEYFDKRDLFVNIPIPNHFKINLKRLKFRKKDMIH